MNKIPYIRSAAAIIILTVLIMLLPDMNNMIVQSSRLNKKTPWKYSGQSYIHNISAKELAAFYTGGKLNEKQLLSSGEIYDYKPHEIVQMLDKCLNDANLKGLNAYFKSMTEEDSISYFSKNRILALINGNIIVLNFVSVSFYDGSYISYEEKTSLLLDLGCAIDTYIDLDQIADELQTYYSDTLGIAESGYYVEIWEAEDGMIQMDAHLQQGESDKEIIFSEIYDLGCKTAQANQKHTDLKHF